MTLTETKLQRLQAAADDKSDGWLGPDTHLDTSSFSIRKKLADIKADAADEVEAWVDPRFGGLVAESRNSLHGELATLAGETETLKELALTNPEAAAKLAEIQHEEEAGKFTAAHPEYWACEENEQRIEEYIEERGLAWDAEGLAVAYRDLLAAGRLKVNPNVPRVVSPDDIIRISRQAADGNVIDALIGYLKLRLPQAVADEISNSPSFEEAENIINRAANQPILREATINVWLWNHPTVRPSEQLRRHFEEYTSEMPSFTLKTLDSAWTNYLMRQETEREITKQHRIFGLPDDEPNSEPPSVAAGLEDLSDTEINRLMKGVAWENARQVRVR